MKIRDFGAAEAAEKYGKEKREVESGYSEVSAEEKKEFKMVQKEKKLKKPGSVSRFFNQFGIGKYWEQLNDYFEQEEKMEKAAAGKEANKETAGDIRAVAEEEVSKVKTKGEEMPTEIKDSAARAGATEEEAAPVVAEAVVEEAEIEQEAEAAKEDLSGEIEILEQKPLMDEVKAKYEKKYRDTPLRQIDAKIKDIEHQMREQDARHEEIERGLRSGKLFKSDKLWAEQKQMEEKREWIEAERNILFEIKKEKTPVRAEKIKVKEVPAWEEVEEPAVAKEAKERAVPSPEEVRPAEVLSEEIVESAEEEMKKAKVEPISLGKRRGVKEGPPSLEETRAAEVLGEEVIEMPPEWKEIKPITSKELEERVRAGGVPKVSTGFRTRLPELSGIMETAFFARGKESEKARLEWMISSLEKVAQAYAAQKAAKEISVQDEKALKKWIAETKGAIVVLSQAPEEMKPVKVVELKKPAKKKPAEGEAA